MEKARTLGKGASRSNATSASGQVEHLTEDLTAFGAREIQRSQALLDARVASGSGLMARATPLAGVHARMGTASSGMIVMTDPAAREARGQPELAAPSRELARRAGRNERVSMLALLMTFWTPPPPPDLSVEADAVRRGRMAEVRALVAAGLDVRRRSADGGTLLHVAAEEGSAAMVRELVRLGVSLDAVDELDRSALLVAAESNNVEAFDAFLELGSGTAGDLGIVFMAAAESGCLHCLRRLGSARVRDAAVTEAVWKALASQHDASVRWLLDNEPAATAQPGELLSTVVGHGSRKWLAESLRRLGPQDQGRLECALVKAMRHRRVDLLTPLLRAGASPDGCRFTGDSRAGKLAAWERPAWMAVLLGQPKVLVQLLDAGADASISDDRGRTLLHVAAGVGDLASFRLLERHGLDASQQDQDGLAAADVADVMNRSSVAEWIEKRGGLRSHLTRDECALALASLGSCGRALPAREGWTQEKTDRLDEAVRLGHVETVLALANQMPEPVNGPAWALTMALELEQVDSVRGLLDRGVPARWSGENGWTHLHVAASKGNEACVRALLRSGADPAAASDFGFTLLDAAVMGGNSAVYELLESSGAFHGREPVPSPLHLAAVLGTDLMIDHLVTRGWEPNIRQDCWFEFCSWDDGCFSTLRLSRWDTCIRFAGCGGNVRDVVRAGATSPLHAAAYMNHPRAIERLLRLGARVDTRGPAGVTPLHVAVEEGALAAAQVLLENGADPNAVVEDCDRWTALDLARLSARPICRELVMASGGVLASELPPPH